MVSTSQVAEKYFALTSEEQREQVLTFLRRGFVPRDVVALETIFDDLLLFALSNLTPLFREFFLRAAEGALLRAGKEERGEEDECTLEAAAMDAAAVALQCLARRRVAARLVDEVRRQKRSKEKEESLHSLSRKHKSKRS